MPKKKAKKKDSGKNKEHTKLRCKRKKRRKIKSHKFLPKIAVVKLTLISLCAFCATYIYRTNICVDAMFTKRHTKTNTHSHTLTHTNGIINALQCTFLFIRVPPKAFYLLICLFFFLCTLRETCAAKRTKGIQIYFIAGDMYVHVHNVQCGAYTA